MKDYKLLLTGAFDDIYVADLVKYLKKENPQVHISYWGYESEFLIMDDKNCLELLDDYYTFGFLPGITRIPIIKEWYIKQVFRRNFRKYSKGKRFDVICVNSVKPRYLYVTDLYKSCSKNLLVVPWGAEVYRATVNGVVQQKEIFEKADYVSGIKTRFTAEVKSKYEIPEEKFVPLSMGSALIDYIINNKDIIRTDDAKRKLGLEGQYTIACGHNATEGQNHIAMIEAINKIKNKLPKNLVLLFPFTYGGTQAYIDSVKNKVKEYSLNAVFFEELLDLPNLFLLRQAADMFIHIQCTDAGSTSVREYLLCGKKVLNGKWLRYPELEANGLIPYYMVDNVDSLDEVIVDAYNSTPIVLNRESIDAIEQRGWGKSIKKWNELFETIS